MTKQDIDRILDDAFRKVFGDKVYEKCLEIKRNG